MARELIVNRNDAGQRLDKFMEKTFRTMPRPVLYKYLRRKCVRLNGTHPSPDVLLREGDVLRFFIRDEFFEAEPAILDYSRIRPNFGVVYEDSHLLVVNKPAGLLCQPDASEAFNTLTAHVTAYLMEKGVYDPSREHSFAPALSNRIDKNTSGLVIAAKDAATLRVMNEKIRAREIDKFYLCLVFGLPVPPCCVQEAWLKKDGETNRVTVRSVPGNGFRAIKTGYRVLATDGQISLLEVELFTGRTHQIRAHMAYLGHPLLGDTKYGTSVQNRGFPFRYQALAACRLRFAFPTPAEHLDYLRGMELTAAPFFADWEIYRELREREKK